MPIKRIMMGWNGKMLYGPIAPQTEKERDDMQTALSLTHYLIIPKTP